MEFGDHDDWVSYGFQFDESHGSLAALLPYEPVVFYFNLNFIEDVAAQVLELGATF